MGIVVLNIFVSVALLVAIIVLLATLEFFMLGFREDLFIKHSLIRKMFRVLRECLYNIKE